MAHTCHAIACKAQVPPVMFMCRRHWYMLSKTARDAIWRHYRVGQCDDWNITEKYAEAAKTAILQIAELEKRIVDPNCIELRLYTTLVP